VKDGLAELLDELEDTPAETDRHTLETVLVRAGYHWEQIDRYTRRFLHPMGGRGLYLRTDREIVAPSIVIMMIAEVRVRTGVQRRQV
jgi:hypothetical protein